MDYKITTTMVRAYTLPHDSQLKSNTDLNVVTRCNSAKLANGAVAFLAETEINMSSGRRTISLLGLSSPCSRGFADLSGLYAMYTES